MKIEKMINNFINKIKRKKELRCIGNFKDISYNDLKKLLKSENITLVDVRSPQEFAEDRLDFAINIPLYDLEDSATKLLHDKNANIVVYCQSGVRSKRACQILKRLGYENLYNLKDGIGNV